MRRSAGARDRATRFVMLVAVLGLACWAAGQTTYHVRPDGGDAVQCTGTADAPYPGSGTGIDCAWDHPFRALPPGGPPRIAGGDTLVIAPGAYRMGHGAPGAGGCDALGAYDCTAVPVPSGPDPDHPTRIVGAGWDAGCPDPPELWGAERAWQVLSLDGSSNVELRCLEITDHSSCIEFHADAAHRCERDAPPYGDWASVGLHASDSASVLLEDVSIHGLASDGVLAGRLEDWTLRRVRISGNGWAGWDGDIDGADGDSGEMVFESVEIAWNGCGELYPDGGPASCWAQQAGGYGDGLAAGEGGGHWVLRDCLIHHNSSDGVDLLYLRPGASTEVERCRMWANAGNQLKVSGPLRLADSELVGSCAALEGWPLMDAGDVCRALGTTLALDLFPGATASIVGCTLAGEGDTLVTAECTTVGGCNGSETVGIRNTVLVGGDDHTQPGDTVALYWTGMSQDPLDLDWSLAWRVKVPDGFTWGPNDLHGADPLLEDGTAAAFDGRLRPGSPALDSGLDAGTVLPWGATVPAEDLRGLPRPTGSGTDRGAWEMGPLEGDADCSGAVDAADLLEIVGVVFGDASTCGATDADCSGATDAADLAVTIRRTGEPAFGCRRERERRPAGRGPR